MMRKHALLLVSGFFAMSTPSVWGVPTIDVGSFNLLENTPGQTIEIAVAGGDAVQGLNLYVATGDGGGLAGGVDGSAPAITGVDLISSGLVFGASNTGQTTPDPQPQLVSASTTTNESVAATVAAQGALARITIDTTGFFYDEAVAANNAFALSLDLTDSLGVATDFAGVAADITNGQIVLVAVPEPALALTALIALPVLMGRRRR